MKKKILSGVAALAIIGTASLGFTSVAHAGPCSDDISALSRKLSQNSALGGEPTSGTLNGSGSGSAAGNAANPDQKALNKGTTADGKVGGEAGMKEMNAASGQVATSSADVRRQQAGVPTTANAPGTPTPNDKMSEAKMELEKARALDAKGDASCAASVARTKQLSNG